jgi:hypothetical protein
MTPQVKLKMTLRVHSLRRHPATHLMGPPWWMSIPQQPWQPRPTRLPNRSRDFPWQSPITKNGDAKLPLCFASKYIDGLRRQTVNGETRPPMNPVQTIEQRSPSIPSVMAGVTNRQLEQPCQQQRLRHRLAVLLR